jgi:hypothetical protein
MGQGRSFRRMVILVVLLVFVLGCGTLPSMGLFPTETPLPPTSTPLPPATATPIPTKTPEPSPTPTETPPPSPTPPPTPTLISSIVETELDDGWYLYTVTEEGFSIAMPPDWYSVELDEEMMGAAVDTLAENNPETASYLDQMLPVLIAQGFKFYGIEVSKESLVRGYPASLNILTQAMPASMSFDRFIEMTATTLETMLELSVPVEQELVDLPSGTVGKLSYSMEAALVTGETMEVVIVQYLIPSGDELYIISFGAAAEVADSYLPIFEQIAESFSVESQ